ncbi:hypothetical protein E2C01_060011 [Portunus trituberculatus]|uniref:Uncharacterized protein n=1 Tax=Portunus trituberculatus TaxID=210409 RepID=A0A5B7H6X9_PORTR|nr:hypothetical protein [Portunus trituberculatus]
MPTHRERRDVAEDGRIITLIFSYFDLQGAALANGHTARSLPYTSITRHEKRVTGNEYKHQRQHGNS